jgi:hypothetical protein
LEACFAFKTLIKSPAYRYGMLGIPKKMLWSSEQYTENKLINITYDMFKYAPRTPGPP